MPDLNSVPLSPHTYAQQGATSPSPRSSTSRRTSTQSIPPASAPLPNILPSNTSSVLAASAAANAPTSIPSSGTAGSSGVGSAVNMDNTGVGAGPGPLRHPRPLTAADLHSQLEKEQEAVVNRLTRELSLLRAASNASVASNTSSTSNHSHHAHDGVEHPSNHMVSGPGHPIPSTRQHHRTSSATSSRSITGINLSTSTGATVAGTRGTLHRHDSNISNASASGISIRRESISGSRPSGASSPAMVPPLTAGSSYSATNDFSSPIPFASRPGLLGAQHTRDSNFSTMANASVSTVSGVSGSTEAGGAPLTSVSIPASQRSEEVAFHKAELERVKRENEMLKQRIRELESGIRERRQAMEEAQEGARGRTGAAGAEVAGDVDEVTVGESARGVEGLVV